MLLSNNNSGYSLVTFSIELTKTSCRSCFSLRSKKGITCLANVGYLLNIFPKVSHAA